MIRATLGFSAIFFKRLSLVGALRLGFSSMGEKNRLPSKAKQIGITCGWPDLSEVARWAVRKERRRCEARGLKRESGFFLMPFASRLKPIQILNSPTTLGAKISSTVT